MKKLLIAATLFGSALSVAAVPAIAEAQSRERVLVCKTSKNRKTTGTVVGAVGGGLLGNAIADGGATGTVLGAGAGALAGREIAKSGGKKRCRYEYRYR